MWEWNFVKKLKEKIKVWVRPRENVMYSHIPRFVDML